MKSKSKHKMDNGKHESSHENPKALLESRWSVDISVRNDGVVDLKEAKSRANFSNCTPTVATTAPRTDHIINPKSKKNVKIITQGVNSKAIIIKCGSKRPIIEPRIRNPSVPSGYVNSVEICNDDSNDTIKAPEIKKSKKHEEHGRNVIIESESVKPFDIENDDATFTPIAQEVHRDLDFEIDKMVTLNEDELSDQLSDQFLQDDLTTISLNNVENMEVEEKSNSSTSSLRAPPPIENLASLDVERAPPPIENLASLVVERAPPPIENLASLDDQFQRDDLAIISMNDVENMEVDEKSNSSTSSPKAPSPVENLASLDVERAPPAIENLASLDDQFQRDDLAIISMNDVENMEVDEKSNSSTSSPKAPSLIENLASLDGHNSSININEQCTFDKTLHTQSDCHPSTPVIEQESKAQNSAKLKDKDTLWGFILHLLCKYEDPPVKWLDKSEGIFKINDTSTFAKLWSEQKCKVDPMSFENITRSIRTYYKKNIIQSWKKENNSWRFGDGVDWKKLVT